MDFIGGTVSGIGNVELNTAWASWTMVILYSRFVILFVLNIFLVITMVVECNVKRDDTKDAELVSENRSYIKWTLASYDKIFEKGRCI